MHAAGTAPTYDTAALQREDSRHYLHPFTDHKSLAAQGARVIVRGEGIYIWDSEGQTDPRRHVGPVVRECRLWPQGAGRRGLPPDAAAAVLQQLLQHRQRAGDQTWRRAASIAPPHFQHVFFTGSGSEGNDTIVRMVRRYWDIEGQPQRKVIISRHNAYHGSTVAGASLGGMKGMHEQGDLPIPGIVHIEQPYHFENGHGMPTDEYGVVGGAPPRRERSSKSARTASPPSSANRSKAPVA